MKLKLNAIHVMKAEEFIHPFTAKIIKMNENSIIVEIMQTNPEDAELAYAKNNVTVVRKRDIGKLIEQGTVEAEFEKQTVKDWNNEFIKRDYRVKIVLMQNGKVIERFGSAKSAASIAGVTIRTVTDSIESDKPIASGRLKGCKFEVAGGRQ